LEILRASLIAAAGTAVVAVVAFGAIHALWIVPIWDRLLGGLPFALVGALALGWAYAECLLARRLPSAPILNGLVFGAGAWLALLPATAASTVLRVTGIHVSHPSWSGVAALGTAGLTGLFIGRRLGGGWRSTLAVGLAVVVLLAVQAGPVPVLNGWRPAGLLLLLAPLYGGCGIVQAVLTARIARSGEPGPAAV
jgi:hypothetical protein